MRAIAEDRDEVAADLVTGAEMQTHQYGRPQITA